MERLSAEMNGTYGRHSMQVSPAKRIYLPKDAIIEYRNLYPQATSKYVSFRTAKVSVPSNTHATSEARQMRSQSRINVKPKTVRPKENPGHIPLSEKMLAQMGKESVYVTPRKSIKDPHLRHSRSGV